MDLEEARRILFSRVQNIDSENAFKLMGYLLLQDWGEQEFLRLALGSEVALHSLVTKAKKELGLNVSNKSMQLGQSALLPQAETCSLPTQALAQSVVQVPSLAGSKSSAIESNYPANPLTNFILHKPNPYPPMMLSQMSKNWPTPRMAALQSRASFPYEYYEERHVPSNGCFDMMGQHPCMGFEEPSNYVQLSNHWASSSIGDGIQPHIAAPLSWKPCLFFSRGYCKHGNSCRFVHHGDNEVFTAAQLSDDYSETTGSDDGVLNSLSLDCLEQELRELLRGRQMPVSIASLPQLYYERFGKSLQADGYMTESQRHGKVGYSLTKLLMRLKGTVTVIERPHGQHAVMLTEDAHKFAEIRGHRDFYAINASSRQIYLTFPPESTFTEEDVTLHFRAYGPVQDVRIPHQQKRMFGFVTFVYPDTVTTILTEGNPHYICGARVLVKPYKEKGKTNERRLHERDAVKHLPAGNRFPAVRYQREDPVTKVVDDGRVLTLERKMAELELVGTQGEQSPAIPELAQQQEGQISAGFDAGESSVCLDDGFNLQSSTFKYVLDLLDGEGKENESSATAALPRLESNTVEGIMQSPDISETLANTVQKIKSHHLQSQQSTFLGQYNWGAPTLFARSVF